MKFLSATLSAAVLTCGLAAGAGPSLAASAGDTAANIQQISDRWDNGGWDRPRHRRHYGWDNDRHRGWGHGRRHHRSYGYYRPHRRCHTEFVLDFGRYGARWIPVERCW